MAGLPDLAYVAQCLKGGFRVPRRPTKSRPEGRLSNSIGMDQATLAQHRSACVDKP